MLYIAAYTDIWSRF